MVEALNAAEAEDVSAIYKRYINLSAEQWLRLANLEQYAVAFNKAGFTNSADFNSVDEKALKTQIGMRNKSHRRRFLAIVKSDSKQPKILADFALVTCKTAQRIFQQAYPKHPSGSAEEQQIMEACVDPRGHGKISKFQLKAFLLRHRGDLSGAMACLGDELGTAPQPHRGPAVTTDEDDLYDFLRRAGLEPLFLVLQQHGVLGPSDLSKSRGITVDMVKQWCPALGWDLEASQRLEKLLGRDDSFMDDEHAPATADMIQCICRDALGNAAVGVCEALVETLAKDPMVGTASQWQVRHLLQLHGDDRDAIQYFAKEPVFAGPNRPSDEVLEKLYGYYGTQTDHDWYKQWLLRSGIGFEQYHATAKGKATDEASMKKFVDQKIMSCSDEHGARATETLKLDRSTPSGEKIYLQFILLSRTAVAKKLRSLFPKQLDAEKLDANKIALDHVDPYTGRGKVTAYQLEETKKRAKDHPDWKLATILKGVYNLSDQKIAKEVPKKPKPEGPVVDFLDQLKLGDYSVSFHKNCVDEMADLMVITDEELKALGVDKLGHRKKILRAIIQTQEE